jgi:hypothetical protein
MRSKRQASTRPLAPGDTAGPMPIQGDGGVWLYSTREMFDYTNLVSRVWWTPQEKQGLVVAVSQGPPGSGTLVTVLVHGRLWWAYPTRLERV